MAKKKIYAVRKGHKTGLFETWAECQKATSGYSGAEFRGFTDREEAMAFLQMSTTANVSKDEEKEAAEKFLVWLNTSETGMKYVIEECSFIPYNADPDVISAGYSLGDSILSYVKEGKTITNAYAGMPASYATFTLGAHLLENYVNTAEWPETAYSDIADFIVSSWSEAAGL